MERAMERMARVLQGVVARLGGDTGQDLIEYALLAGLIAVVAIGAITALGNQVFTVFWTPIVQNF
jgi:Flp pilus assembly pilin Flp